jgi:hypothetical protein
MSGTVQRAAEKALQNQQPLIIPSLDAETRFPAVAGMLKKRGVRSVCALPLTTIHRRLGGVSLWAAERPMPIARRRLASSCSLPTR